MMTKLDKYVDYLICSRNEHYVDFAIAYNQCEHTDCDLIYEAQQARNKQLIAFAKNNYNGIDCDLEEIESYCDLFNDKELFDLLNDLSKFKR